MMSLGACHEATAPLSDAALRGNYVAVSVNGGGLPANLNPGSYPIYVVADTLRFDGAGNVIHAQQLSEPTLQQQPQPKLSSLLSYQVDGTAVHFYFVCPPFAACARAPDGHLVLGLSWLAVNYGNGVFLYKKVH